MSTENKIIFNISGMVIVKKKKKNSDGAKEHVKTPLLVIKKKNTISPNNLTNLLQGICNYWFGTSYQTQTATAGIGLYSGGSLVTTLSFATYYRTQVNNNTLQYYFIAYDLSNNAYTADTASLTLPNGYPLSNANLSIDKQSDEDIEVDWIITISSNGLILDQSTVSQAFSGGGSGSNGGNYTINFSNLNIFNQSFVYDILLDSFLGLTSLCAVPLELSVYGINCNRFYSPLTSTPTQAGVFNGNTIAVVQGLNSNASGFASSGCEVTAFTLNANSNGIGCGFFCYAGIPAPNISSAYLIPLQMQFVFNGV